MFMINGNRLLESFLTLAQIDGIHGRELDVARHLLAELTSLGLDPRMDDAGSSFGGNSGNVFARMNGFVNAPTILLCAHMDTIQSTRGLKYRRANGIITSDGTTILGGDDRSGVAIILEILRILQESHQEHGPLEVLFTVCEEAGMHGAKIIKRADVKADFGFVFDCQASPGNYIVEAPGAVSFKAIVRGRSAHAAVSPEKGIHAIEIASKAISELKLGRWDETGMLNIGTIHGGTAINVVPDVVEITGETRNTDDAKLQTQMDYIHSAFLRAAAHAGGAVDVEFVTKYGGYQFKEENPMIATAQRAITAVGLKPTPLKYAGGSDANVLNSKGIPMLNLGVGFKNAHSFQESIAEEDLIRTAEIGLSIVRLAVQSNQVTSTLNSTVTAKG
jgi:tripeptide aminopeptidase